MPQDCDCVVREVGLRDGLQGVDLFVPTDLKLRWIRGEAAAGVGEIEVASYVPPRVVPQFADAAEVTAASLQVPSLVVSALVPNLMGAQRGVELHAHKLNYVISVSQTHNARNVRRSREDSIREFAHIVSMISGLCIRPVIAAGLATAFGCSHEGPIDEDDVLRCACELIEAGADELVVADTVGYATPAQVKRLFRRILAVAGPAQVAAHFHDTRGTGLANVLAAMDAGVRTFDASLGGLGGCQFARGASGNIVTEDLCYMLESMGVRTGIDVAQLIALSQEMRATMPSLPFGGSLVKAGLPLAFASQTCVSLPL